MANESIQPPSANPFDDLGGENDNFPASKSVQTDAAKPEGQSANPFDEGLPELGPQGTATGAFVRGAERAALPVAGGLAAGGTGAAIFGGIGSAAGPVGTAIGGIGGFLLGGIGGSYAVSAAQDWALSKLPDSWREAIGQDDRQQKLDQEHHGTAAFMGGLLPYALTLKPTAKGLIDLPANATTLQRILANPVTARVFGGTMMGGMELAQEAGHGQSPDWTNVGIATGFGVVFPSQNRFGDRITSVGPQLARRARGLGEPTAEAPAQPEAPEAAPAAAPEAAPAVPDVQPGFVRFYHGGDNPAEGGSRWVTTDPEYARNFRAEGQPKSVHYVDIPENDPAAVSLRRWDELDAGTNIVGTYRHGEIPEEWAKQLKPFEATKPHGVTEKEWNETILGQKPPPTLLEVSDAKVMGPGVTESVFQGTHDQSPQAAMAAQQQLRNEKLALGESPIAQDVHQTARQAEPELFERYEQLQSEQADFRRWIAESEETGGAPEAAKHLKAIDAELEGIAPQIGAAYRRAADFTGGATVEPNVSRETTRESPGSLLEQRNFIAQDVEQNLVAAGRPADEARAAAQVVAARYETRAERFGGKLGTARELYLREGPEIVGPDGKAVKTTTPERDREDLSRLINTNAAPAEIAAHPVVKEALAYNASRPSTTKLPGYGTPEFKANREYDFQGEKVKGYEPAISRLEQDAKAYSTKGPVKHEREAILVWGPPAAGKSRFAEKLAQERRAAIADPDDAKKVIPGFEGGRAASAVHEESAEMSADVLKRLVSQGANLVLPRVGHNLDSARQYVTQLQDQGYRVSVVNMTVDPAEAYRRMIRRFLKSGRVIGSDYFSGVGTKPRENYYTLKQEGLFDEGIDIDANGPPGTQRVLDHPESKLATDLGFGGGRSAEGLERAGEPAEAGAAPEPQAETVAAEPVHAASEAVEKINTLTPAQQKRELPTFNQERDATLPHPGPDKPAGVFMFDPTTLHIDPKRFQFKSGGDEYGITGALRNVQKWDPAKAQAIIAWEQNDGKVFVADGHQRAGLARRLTAEGKAKDVQLPGILYREVDGISADDMRAIAAVTNIANGSGSALDGAKVLRARPDLMDESLPLTHGKGQQAAALARLGDEPFRMVVNEVIPEHYGAIVGELIPTDHARQTAAVNAIARFEPRSAEEATVLTQRVAAAELAKREEGAQASMFGDLETAESTAGEEMKIVGRVIRDLKKDKGLFGRVVANAERIEATGSKIERGAAQTVMTDAEVFAKTLATDAYAAGPVRTELVAAARDLKNGKSSLGQATDRILAAVRQQAEAHGADRTGDSGRAAEPAKEFAQSKEPEFEPGAEGKPQQLIPGVEPVSQRERIQRLANEPLRGGAKPMDEGLFGERRQGELFQRDQHQTPEFKRWFGESKVVDADGNPQVVYHGTDKNFRAFNPKKTTQGVTWFTSNKSAIEAGDVGAAGSGRILDLYASIKNPAGWAEYEKFSLGELKSRGYDGAILPNRDGTFDGFAFEPEQLKSASKNRGTFDPDNPRLYEQTARGKVRIAEGRKPLITLMKDANASTFMHESGHVWLEELQRDAFHPQAPDVVKADAETVRDWLGVKDPDDIKTRHHEKFARGFEQYLREGVAPSPELAGVFVRFKDWLLRIYETLKGLGSPINDDIRGVFDRMLSAEPQRTVVAPEREPTGPTIHDIHETEARDMTPTESGPAADRVRAEKNRYAAEATPEVKNELEAKIAELQAENDRLKAEAGGAKPAGAEPAGEAGGGEAGGGDLEPGSGKPGALTAGGEGGAESGKVESGGGGAAGESAASRDVDTGNPLAPKPASLFGPEQSPYLDKAGNIRLDTLTNLEEARQAIRDAAAANQDFIGDRRGVVTDGQVMDVARAAGMEGAERLVKNRIVGQAFSAEEVMILRVSLIESATNLSATMKKAATGSDADVMAYAQAKDRHRLLQATVSQATAEAGRALRAFRNIAGLKPPTVEEATGKTLFQLRQEAQLGATLDTPEAVSKFMADSQKRTFGHMMLEYWINGLLSGPATHSTNIIGNMILTVQHMAPETAIAAGIGAVRRSFGREGETVRLGEIGARLRAGAAALPSAFKAAGESFARGANLRLPGEEPRALPYETQVNLATQPTLHEDATYTSVMGDAFGAVQGLRDAVIATGQLVKAGGESAAPLISTKYSLSGAIPDIQVKGITALPIGTVARLPGRFLSAADGFFRALNYSMEKNARAYRTAANEGLEGTAFDARVADIRQNPTEAMMTEIAEESSRLTLMNKGGKFLNALQHLAGVEIGGFPAFKFITPFVHVAGNILKQAVVERTPFGLLSPEIRADLAGKNGTVAQDMAGARMLLGTGLSITMGMLAAEGYASGSGPTDPNEAAAWRLAGNQPHSVRIGDTWYSVQKLGPLGLLMGLAADTYDISKSASEGDMAEAASHTIHAFSQNILDQSVMKGPSDLLRAVNDSDRYGSQYVRSFLSSFVPYSVGMAQVARMGDPASVQARTVVDAIRAKIPGHLDSYFDNPLFPRRDIWGMPIINETVGGVGVTGIAQRQISTDPVNLALVELGVSPAPVQRKIRNVELTDKQFDEFAQTAGRMTKQRLDVIVNSPDWSRWPNYVKTLVLEESVKQSREVARGLMMARYPQLVKDATELRLDKFRD